MAACERRRMPQTLLLLLFLVLATIITDCKYLEGVLQTNEKWMFLARFCFLSEQGQFEYSIEYNDEQGTPNLLLYYDASDQWPAVYKTNKTCNEKEAVLKMEQNQVINLTATVPYFKEFSGCMVTPLAKTTEKPLRKISVPTVPWRKHNVTTTTKPTTADTVTTIDVENVTENFNDTAYELLAMNETRDVNLDFENIDILESTTDVSTTQYEPPIRKRSVANYFPRRKTSRTIVCHNARRFRSSRERWWFLAISNCNGTKGINIKYRILMTNGPPGDYWHEHFSADEFYILPILMAFTVAYSLLMLSIVLCSIELKSRQLLHSTYKLFVVSVMLQFIGILLQSMAYLKYAVNGVGTPKLKLFSSMLMGSSETCFLLLLLLLAKGYTVTRGRLPVAASIKLTIFMCIYAVTYITLFVYEAKVFDPGEVLYLYESPAGYGLIILRVGAWCMFVYSTIFTLKHYPEKANFYYPFNICGTLWFVAGPAFILSANSYIDKWVRESVVCAVLLFITFGGHLMFMLLTMPSVANKNFPYHVRTTQIGIMELTGGTGVNTIEQFGHHAYEPTSTITEQTVIIPLTRRTEEIFEGIYSHHIHSNHLRNNNSDELVNSPHDTSMENVLNWSLAKNLPALDISSFEHVKSDISSARSGLSENSNRVSRRSSTNQYDSTIVVNNRSESPINHFDDYVRDVPVELFTVSKMVVTTTNLKKNNN